MTIFLDGLWAMLAIVLTWALAGLGIVFGLALGVVLVLLLGSLFLERDE